MVHKTITKDISGVPLAVIQVSGHVGMLVRKEQTRSKTSVPYLQFVWSKEGLSFSEDTNEVTLALPKNKKEKLKDCFCFSLSAIHEGYVLMYIRKTPSGKGSVKNILVTAFSKNLYTWKVKSEEETSANSSAFVHDSFLDTYVLYTGGLFIRSFVSPRFGHFPKINRLIATSRLGAFDEGPLTIIGVQKTDRGIILLYDASMVQGENTLIQAGVLLLNNHNPDKVLWRAEGPLWQSIVETKKGQKVVPIGVVRRGNTLRMYFYAGDCVVIASIPALFTQAPTPTAPVLKKVEHNPLLRPQTNRTWEAEGTFNPAAFMDKEGYIHILYRAIGSDGMSRVGYAECKGGLHITHRHNLPIFEPSMGFGVPDPRTAQGPKTYSQSLYTSGGSWSGAEDPRTVVIDDRIYMTYVAFEGWYSMRMALTSISLDDFKNKRWYWKKPVLISAPGQANKNWVLFPEKINGKYAILHGIAPEVSIDYVDSLDDFTGTNFIVSKRLPGPQPGREGYWDSLLRGVGPPPLKTKMGWLIFYHAVDKKDLGKYKLGAMILDADVPAKILYRSSAPILSPDEAYENDGKPGVVYASGAVIKNGTLYVYYGGADKVVCVATAPLDEFLAYLKSGKTEGYKLHKGSIASF